MCFRFTKRCAAKEDARGQSSPAEAQDSHRNQGGEQDGDSWDIQSQLHGSENYCGVVQEGAMVEKNTLSEQKRAEPQFKMFF